MGLDSFWTETATGTEADGVFGGADVVFGGGADGVFGNADCDFNGAATFGFALVLILVLDPLLVPDATGSFCLGGIVN